MQWYAGLARLMIDCTVEMRTYTYESSTECEGMHYDSQCFIGAYVPVMVL